MSSRKIKNLNYFANAIHPGPEGARFCCVVRDKSMIALMLSLLAFSCFKITKL